MLPISLPSKYVPVVLLMIFIARASEYGWLQYFVNISRSIGKKYIKVDIKIEGNRQGNLMCIAYLILGKYYLTSMIIGSMKRLRGPQEV